MSTAAWSADGRVLAAGGADGALWLWRLPGRRPQRLVRTTGRVGELALQPRRPHARRGRDRHEQPRLAERDVPLYDVASGKRIDDLPVGWEVEGARVRPGRAHARHGALRLRSRGGRAAELRLWRSVAAEEARTARTAAQERRRVRGRGLRAGRRTMAVARSDGTVQLVATRDWKPAVPPLRGLGGGIAFSKTATPSPLQPEESSVSGHSATAGHSAAPSATAARRPTRPSASRRRPPAVAVDDAAASCGGLDVDSGEPLPQKRLPLASTSRHSPTPSTATGPFSPRRSRTPSGCGTRTAARSVVCSPYRAA